MRRIGGEKEVKDGYKRRNNSEIYHIYKNLTIDKITKARSDVNIALGDISSAQWITIPNPIVIQVVILQLA